MVEPIKKTGNKKVDEMVERYASMSKVPCPKCKSNKSVVPMLYGDYNDLFEQVEKLGYIHCGGCEKTNLKNYCKSCKKEF